ncbi:MAG TPA: hypothetical protein VIK48_00110 [Candidatus Manganitrophaceae bacterium]|nr:hypothetical protein [Candidatus Manganitrophaceae bacterium]
MKRILHILKRKNDPYPLEIIRKQSETNEVTVILIQEATHLELKGTKASVSILREDQEEGRPASYPSIGYKEMLDRIFNADLVVTW